MHQLGPPASSCPDLIRASTSFSAASEGVDGRIKSGHDDLRCLTVEYDSLSVSKI